MGHFKSLFFGSLLFYIYITRSSFLFTSQTFWGHFNRNFFPFGFFFLMLLFYEIFLSWFFGTLLMAPFFQMSLIFMGPFCGFIFWQPSLLHCFILHLHCTFSRHFFFFSFQKPNILGPFYQKFFLWFPLTLAFCFRFTLYSFKVHLFYFLFFRGPIHTFWDHFIRTSHF